ncbi:hypothetical protein DYB31_007441 [Aphanomyces astaci]|uniref:Uncharacterized protein n=1 Tax=Aphanomyces astaci TaxID=112090 RepID=A0A397ESE0_APHAT|nr:hypothetical protein DYB31_007441 [Aphanomyces astaci]
MLPSPLPDKAQAQAHRLLSSGDDDECRKFIRENNIDMDLPNAQGCTLLITACAFAINGSSNHSTRTSEVLELLQHAWVLLEAAADQRSQELLLSSYFTQDTPQKQPKAKRLVSSTPPAPTAIPTTTTTTASTKKKKKKSKAITNRQRTSAAGANKDSLVTKHFTDDSKEDSTDEPTVVCVQKPPSPQHSITAQVKPNSNIPSVNDDDDEGPKDVTDDEADVLYDTFPLLRTMGISLAHFALHELDGLSMAQLDMLQDAHMHAFTVIGDKKVQVARQLEADRIHAAYELEQHIFNLG